MTADERTCLSHWFPPIEAAGLPVPATYIVRTDIDLSAMLDGLPLPGLDGFLDDLRSAAREIGYPCFLRTGLGSGKHEWAETCYLADPSDLGQHVVNLVEWSHLVDLMGLAHGVWVVRALIPTEPLFVAFKGFPVTREFRVFIRDDEWEATFPYWPEGSIAAWPPADCPDWRERLAAASVLSDDEDAHLAFLAGWASGAVGGGYWSIDFLQDKRGEWWLIDMAAGERSFRPDGDGATA